MEQINNLRFFVRSVPVDYHLEVLAHWGVETPLISSNRYPYCFHIAFVKSGHIQLAVGDNSKNTLVLNDSCFAVFSPNSPVTVTSFSEHTVYYGIDFIVSDSISGTPCHQAFDISIHSTIQTGLYFESIFVRLKELYELKHFPLERRLAGSLLHFLLGEFYSQIKHPWVIKFKNSVIESLCAKLHCNPQWNPSVEELSKAAGISKYHFSRLFRKNTGLSPHQYIIQERLRHARKLIIEKGYSVGEASELCGYSDIYTFSKQFKKVYGYPPSETKCGLCKP